jgi:hypothetical protein
LGDGEVTHSTTNVDLGEGDSTVVRPDGAKVVTEKLEHLNSHPTSFAHPPLAGFSQCWPGGQHSEGAEMSDVPGERTRA